MSYTVSYTFTIKPAFDQFQFDTEVKRIFRFVMSLPEHVWSKHNPGFATNAPEYFEDMGEVALSFYFVFVDVVYLYKGLAMLDGWCELSDYEADHFPIITSLSQPG